MDNNAKERRLAAARAWKAQNKERVRASRAAYYAKNKERERATNEAWKAANPEKYQQTKIRSNREYRAAHREELRQKARTPEARKRRTKLAMLRYYSDELARIRMVLSSCLRQALGLRGVRKTHSISELVGCSLRELKDHLNAQLPPGAKLGRDWHIDHRRPCASFDLSDPEQQKQCFHFTNLQVLSARSNIVKGAVWNGVDYRKTRRS